MHYRLAEEKDYPTLAALRWQHAAEDDADYGGHNLANADARAFTQQFTAFLRSGPGYSVFVAEEDGVILCTMAVYTIPKLPAPGHTAQSIAYLTNVYTRAGYRSRGIGAGLLGYIKGWLSQNGCELLFVWPSVKAVPFYLRGGFTPENDILQCTLLPE